MSRTFTERLGPILLCTRLVRASVVTFVSTSRPQAASANNTIQPPRAIKSHAIRRPGPEERLLVVGPFVGGV